MRWAVQNLRGQVYPESARESSGADAMSVVPETGAQVDFEGELADEIEATLDY